MKNYSNWCSYLNVKPNVWLTDSHSRHGESDHRRELLYVSLYLLIWGESANLRFVPECICYIFHNMAMEMNKILEDYIDDSTGMPYLPSVSGENAYLNKIVKQIYDTINDEVENSKNGTAPHSAWRNYDDINEYFWSKRCFEKLKWPIDLGSNFLVTGHKGQKVGKTGFVEQRSFWNLFRSFDKLWILLFLFLQAAIIVAWEGREYPWQSLRTTEVQGRCLTVFITWSALRLLKSLLDIGMQYSLVSRETKSLMVRIILKTVVAAGWIVVFGVFYWRILDQKDHDNNWDSGETKRRTVNFLEVVVAFLAPELLAGSTFVGRGLREGLVDNIKYSLFWIVVLSTNWAVVASSYSDLPNGYTDLFNLMPKEQLLNARGNIKNKIKDVIHRLKLRYGLGRPFKKLESNQVEAYKFALIWNEVIKTFREEDIVSYREVELLELFQNDGNDPISNWPCLLLCNELLLALNQAKELIDAPDRNCELGKFTKTYNLIALPKIYNKLVRLLDLVVKIDLNADKVVNALQALYEVAIRDFLKDPRNSDQLIADGLAPQNAVSGEALLFQSAVELPSASNEAFYRRVRRLHTILTSRDSMQKVPENLEARRRIAFFSNSLFMNMPHAPQVEKMRAFSVLTPYYNEERMRREGMKSERELWTTRLRDLRLWASYRGQTLTRTVRGMMYYYRALELLAFLDSASEVDMGEGSPWLSSMRRNDEADRLLQLSPTSRTLSRASSSVSLLYKGHERGTALMKFTYVVACQIYGSQKAKKDPYAEEILYLMKNNEALRVAYVDEVQSGRDEKEYYSVLVKYDQKLQKEVEIYRVKLPGPVKLGKGKPENQNHAIIFTRGDAVQTIDMNQDNYFEEALKMQNLLEEFKSFYGIRKPTILGETSFVTLGKRVLANPLKVRMHYGHPDVFDRFWFLTRVGISKASRVINISEDIFAGFNCTLRGGNVTHHEYIQAGSSSGLLPNAFILLYNCCLFLQYHVYAFLWGRLYMALSGVEGAALSNANENRALGTILNQQLIIQLGLFTALPMVVENTLEHGFLNSIWDFLTMLLHLSSVFYTFSMGTRGHYFGRTVLHGGAKYRATVRGFVVQHKSFAENYRLYARSHFVKAIELGLILTVYASYSPVATDTLVYIALTITSWFLVVWFKGSVFAKSEQSWEKWWYEEQDHLRTTGLWGKMLEIILNLRFFFFQYGIVYHLSIAAGSKSVAVYLLSWIYVFVAFGFYWVIAYAREKYAAKEHIYYRLVQFLVIIFGVVVIVALLQFTDFKLEDFFTSLLAFIPTGRGFICIAQVFRPSLQKTTLWEIVISVARMYGVIVMAPCRPSIMAAWFPEYAD
ncbi:hypothetical protein SASPL_153925 [Salvia splendens]|uniref:1,3-beta-glucan synthase n=1 Tax=Salvia splendens TaxID=180675 RepID=A0A8X8VZ84_SALSN|nr:hypothetical protein SASPL_153925 [Salvia splendens]